MYNGINFIQYILLFLLELYMYYNKIAFKYMLHLMIYYKKL